MRIDWAMIEDGRADGYDGRTVELDGWWIAPQAGRASDLGLLVAEAPCCPGCAPTGAAQAVEVHLDRPMAPDAGRCVLRGRWQRTGRDASDWNYRLLTARCIDTPTPARGRRLFLSAGAALGLVACSAGRFDAYRDPNAADAPSKATATVDIHSHAGRIIVSRDPAIGANRPFAPLAAPMRDGGMHVVCLAVVADTLVTRVSADRRRIEAFRAPQPGELYDLVQTGFARVATLVERDGLHVITTADALDAAPSRGPSIIVATEGADFLEGRIDRVDEAWREHRLRHLQLTHYRVNELGDIQTEPPVHGGLTDFGADVVRRCNALGIVVDVAHGTYDLVKHAAAVTTKPLVLSHTSLAERPGPRSRQISADHARVIAGTGGVIGVWPNGAVYADLGAMAQGAKRLADVVGVDHVGLGSDMFGFITPPVFTSYRQLPAYVQALAGAGFAPDEIGRMLGGNYARVFRASLG